MKKTFKEKLKKYLFNILKFLILKFFKIKDI